MKKILSFLMALALSVTCLATFVGCGNKGNVEKGATIIRMIALEMPDYQKNWYKKVEDEFNSNLNDGIQLKIIYDTKANLSSSIATTLEGQEQTAIYWCSPGNLYATFVKPRYAANIENYISKEAIDDLTPQAKEAVTLGGKMYAYPMYFEPSMMFFYNKAAFEEVGAPLYDKKTDTYNVPKTWGELMEACRLIKAKTSWNSTGSKYPISVPWGTALYWATTGMELNTTGKQAIDETWMDLNIDENDPAWQAMSGFFWDIYINNYAPATMDTQLKYDDIVSNLIRGQFAMTIGYSAGMALVNQQYGDSPMFDKIGFAEMPVWEHAKNTAVAPSVNGGWTYVINSRLSSEDATKAAKVIEFFTYADPARTAELFIASAYSRVSPNKSVRDYMDTLTIDAKYDYRHLIQDIADRSIFAPHYFDGAQGELASEAYDMRKLTKETKALYGAIPSTDPIAVGLIKDAIATAKTKMREKLDKDGFENPFLTPAQPQA